MREGRSTLPSFGTGVSLPMHIQPAPCTLHSARCIQPARCRETAHPQASPHRLPGHAPQQQGRSCTWTALRLRSHEILNGHQRCMGAYEARHLQQRLAKGRCLPRRSVTPTRSRCASRPATHAWTPRASKSARASGMNLHGLPPFLLSECWQTPPEGFTS